jgi:hypothetical protein
MQNLLRAAAAALAKLSERANQWADNWPAAGQRGIGTHSFAGVDFVGIDFSTSIQQVAGHVIHGWDRYRRQVEILRPDHGVWVFGVNAVPFPLTSGPTLPRQLPRFCLEQFQHRGHGRGLIEYGSAFYDYFLMALEYVQQLEVSGDGGQASLPITIALLCDGYPNGGVHRAGDVRPLIETARARGVRFKLVGVVQRKYRSQMRRFCDSLGLTGEELEVAWYEDGVPDEQTIGSGFDSLSHF